MSTLELICNLAHDELPDWQEDAVLRLLTQNELTKNDKLEILAMLKERNGLIDPSKPAPKPRSLEKGIVSGASPILSSIILKAIQNTFNINAITNGSELSFGHEGLTVVYGKNGSGKSAYARILKRACNARDDTETILPNAFKEDSSKPASATIKISLDGRPDDYIAWEEGQKKSDILSSICVYDSRCARIIIDDDNEPTYLPYGADVFGKLVNLLQELQEQLKTEKPKPNKSEFDDIPPTTKAGQFISQLNHNTTLTIIDEKTNWTEENELKLSNFIRDISIVDAQDHKGHTQRLFNSRDRLDMIINNIVIIEESLSESNTNILRQAISHYLTIESASAIVSKKSFSEEPLAGVGGNPWQVLYTAAREYSTQVAYPDLDFPMLDDDALCVFCMQPLQENAKSRMRRFKDFMEGTTKKQLDSALNTLQEKRKYFEQLTLPTNEIIKIVLDEIRSRNESLAAQMEEYFLSVQSRHTQILRAITNKTLEPFTSLKPIAIECLVKISDQIEKDAQHIEQTSKPEELAANKVARDELQAWKLLSQRKQKLLTYVTQLHDSLKYDKCIGETSTTLITKRGKDIISEALSDSLINALRDELKFLNANHLPLNLRISGIKGETFHKMILSNSCLLKAKLSSILSEGEQDVVSIAGFLAELATREHKWPIIFDDPVCSLDHHFREKIANRLAKEATIRQVIVFTHDISFLFELENKAGKHGAKYTVKTVERHSNIPGYCRDGVPWHAMKVTDRNVYLDNLLTKFKGSYNVDMEKYNKEASYLYDLLRQTWEASVEEVLFNDTVVRFGNTVHTENLNAVIVKTDDYKDIHWGMSQCSTWCAAHDMAKSLDEDRPSPGDIGKDINDLITFQKRIKSRLKETAKARKQAISPQQTTSG